MAYNTLPIQPHKILETTPEFNTKIITYNGGIEQRVSKWVAPKRKWKCVYNGLSVNEKNTLVNFFIGNFGRLKPFYFYNYIDEQQYLVRFADDKMTIEHINAYFFNIEFDLVEVFDNAI